MSPDEYGTPVVGSRVLWAALVASTFPLFLVAAILYAVSRNPAWLTAAAALAAAGAIGGRRLWVRGEHLC